MSNMLLFGFKYNVFSLLSYNIVKAVWKHVQHLNPRYIYAVICLKEMGLVPQ